MFVVAFPVDYPVGGGRVAISEETICEGWCRVGARVAICLSCWLGFGGVMLCSMYTLAVMKLVPM